ncbi:MAG: hypothetical protein ACRC7V_05785 [Lachnospiraceae bacterium]
MNERGRRLQKQLKHADEEQVKIFYNNKPSCYEEVSKINWVNEEMEYVPEFIVCEDGQVKEIYFKDSSTEY